MKRLWRAAGVAAVYIGTVIGAGFASGREIWEFFSRYGRQGRHGILLSALFLVYLGVKAMLWGQRMEARSYRDFLFMVAGPRLGRLGEWLMTLFLLVLTGIMLAGAGAVTVQQGIPWAVGCWGTVFLAVLVLKRRLSGIKGVNMALIPLLFLVGIMLQIKETSGILWEQKPDSSGAWWILSACQYSGYNLFLALPVLVTMYQLEKDPAVLRWGGVLGGIGLGALAFLFHQAISGMDGFRWELPLMMIIKGWGQVWGWIYAFVLWGELFSTLLAHAFGLATRLGWVNQRWYVWQLTLLLAGTVLISRVGFADLIRLVYPVFGLFSILMLIPLALKPLPVQNSKSGKSSRKHRIITE